MEIRGLTQEEQELVNSKTPMREFGYRATPAFRTAEDFDAKFGAVTVEPEGQ